MKPNLLPFIREKWAGVAQPTSSFAGKTVIVTGANVGLGFEAAAKFTSLDAEKVILGVRNVDKGKAAQRKIEDRTHRKDVLDVWELDMDSYESIQRFTVRVHQELPRLDVAVLNAGVSPKDYVVGSEGWESILQVNVLGTALLGLLLLPKMEASKTSEKDVPHLVVVTSEAHRWLEANDFPDASGYGGNLLKAVNAKPADGKWDGMLQNARSKLFAMYVTDSLAAIASEPNASGWEVGRHASECAIEALRHNAGLGYTIALKIFDWLFNKSTEEGARVYVSAASLGSESHGKWYKTIALTK